jgi:hypothetical protein
MTRSISISTRLAVGSALFAGSVALLGAISPAQAAPAAGHEAYFGTPAWGADGSSATVVQAPVSGRTLVAVTDSPAAGLGDSPIAVARGPVTGRELAGFTSEPVSLDAVASK